MEVILTEDVPNLGEMGEVVNVAPGYGRNYLIPKGLALPASAAKKSELNHQKRQIEVRKEKERTEALTVQSKLQGVRITIPKRVAEEDTLYGSVSGREIAEVLGQEGFEVEHRFVMLKKPIDELGIYKVPIKLASGVFAEVTVWVVTV